jgi:NAD(P)H-hydrate epimerase
LAQNKTWLSFIPKGSVLTPHPGEFKRLVGDYSDGYERISKQKDFSVKYNVYLVCKGMHTTITYPDGKCYFNSTGNPGMATGGSGDVLTGIILGLASQGYPYGQACLVGVYLHGLSGDLAKDKHGEDSMVAGDIVEYLGSSFNILKNNT